MFLGLDIVVVLKAVLCQHLLHFLVGTRSNLVDHRPGKGNVSLVLQVVKEGYGHQTVGHPFLSVGHDAGLHLVAVVRAVVHRLDGKRSLSCLPTLIEQSADLAHGEHGLQTTSQVGIVERVSFLGDGEGDHLQRWVAEDLDEPLPVRELWISLQCFCDGGNDLFLDRSVRAEVHTERQVVVGCVGLVDDLEVECLGYDDTAVVLTGVQCIVEDSSWESPEDIASAEVYPCGFLSSLLAQGLDIELRKLITFGFPL